ncbi:uncharacterized protein RCC_07757 [Ramularia collo-cygni]|uniref:Uncharacterized protein n=1 Tax=Ramularia collo-cygni TaxID=112498 RepID=A0A2D3UYB8_9PEZI|nr:uncharacterized protein RCC_07757 [Ramularia collo-cygni]CZT21891.1 uncharacterized protein RCC_07757 [Ramularia collo-cygni]
MATLPTSSTPPSPRMADTPAEVLIMPQPAEDLASAAEVSQPEPIVQGVIDPGWDTSKDQVGLLADGIINEEIWMLVRRLNKVVFSVKHTPRVSPDGLDLDASPDQDFSPNKMRAQLERLYMGIIIGSLAFVKHISRLRSWNEKTRTGVFCSVYFFMWAIDYLMPAALIFLWILVISPKARATAFPPAPISLVGTLSGNLTKPNAGILGSVDSVTGAPENMQGEAVENESSNFVTGLAAIGVNIMSSGEIHGEPNTEENSFSGSMKATPNELVQMIATGKDKAEGIDRPSMDKSKGPMETIMWSFAKSGMTGMESANNIWEKFANLLDPKPPFNTSTQSATLASILLAICGLSLILTRNMFLRSMTLTFGMALFGGPLMKSASSWMESSRPGWSEYASLERTILHGVPNNNQLALALLRQGEKQSAPLPPPPTQRGGVSHDSVPLTSDVLAAASTDLPLGATPEELLDATAPNEELLDEAGGDDIEISKTNSKEPHKVLRIMKGAAKLGVRGFVALDKTRAKLGHPGAKNRVGVVPSKKFEPVIGPTDFDASYEGKVGILSIDGANSTLTFSSKNEKVWSVPIPEITALRKHSGYGFKTKMTAGWALDQRLSDSLGFTDSRGNVWAFTAIPKRDALFNRLIAIGEQKWELM